jgi:hypothetical protein
LAESRSGLSGQHIAYSYIPHWQALLVSTGQHTPADPHRGHFTTWFHFVDSYTFLFPLVLSNIVLVQAAPPAASMFGQQRVCRRVMGIHIQYHKSFASCLQPSAHCGCQTTSCCQRERHGAPSHSPAAGKPSHRSCPARWLTIENCLQLKIGGVTTHYHLAHATLW